MKPTNLIQKLAAIRTMAGAVAKNKTGFGYKYSDITEILAKITAGMNRHNVSLIPMIKPDTTSVTKETMVNTKLDKTGKPYENTATEMQVQAEMVFRWVNNDDPQDFLDVPWVLIGSQSDPSQAFGSALTYCTRYFLTSYFQIAQMETDVDKGVTYYNFFCFSFDPVESGGAQASSSPASPAPVEDGDPDDGHLPF